MIMVPSRVDIEQAHQRIEPYIHETPVLTCASLDKLVGAQLFFKCENFQKIGAFKMRGAANHIFSTDSAKGARGFVTHSSGNHGQAVAHAAQLYGAKAYIVMPENSARPKMEAVKNYGAELITCAPNDQARAEMSEKIRLETGALFVHPFNDYQVIAGQATASKEFIKQVKGLDVLITPVGGGGLAAGAALSLKYWQPETALWLAEPENLNDTAQSFRAGERLVTDKKPSLADGLRTNVGDLTFPILLQHAKGVWEVSEKEMIAAMRLIWERMKILIEPSCAVPLAAAIKYQKLLNGRQVGIILTGGNVDLDHLPF